MHLVGPHQLGKTINSNFMVRERPHFASARTSSIPSTSFIMVRRISTKYGQSCIIWIANNTF
eukprot:Gb_23679 [translate_table: standard]